jgi:hypothetical protein
MKKRSNKPIWHKMTMSMFNRKALESVFELHLCAIESVSPMYRRGAHKGVKQ